jgi:hypothetical protein
MPAATRSRIETAPDHAGWSLIRCCSERTSRWLGCGLLDERLELVPI